MPNVTVQRDIAASPAQVWAVLADFPNISDWNSGVKASHATSDAVEGVGAKRHCDISPVGALEETITGWTPEKEMKVSIDEARRIPVKKGEVTFTLGEADGTTPMTLSYDFTANGGPLAGLERHGLSHRVVSRFGRDDEVLSLGEALDRGGRRGLRDAIAYDRRPRGNGGYPELCRGRLL